MDFFWSVAHHFRLGSKQYHPNILFVKDNGKTQELYAAAEDLPPIPANHVRIVCMSDTHMRHGLVVCPQGDIFCHTGDILFEGRHYSSSACEKHYQEFNNWLSAIPCANKIVIAGNHDVHLERIGTKAAAQLLSNATYLCNSSVSFHGLRFFGSPISVGSSLNSSFQSDSHVMDFYSQVQSVQYDIMLTHGPLPKETVARLAPQVHVWGHIHGRYGARQHVRDSTTWASICACTLDGSYDATHGAVVLDVPAPARES